MDKRTVNRRIFLSKSTACMAGVGIAGSGAMFGREISPREQLQPEIREYRTLGRTGFKVSDIGCGFPGTASESVRKRLLPVELISLIQLRGMEEETVKSP